MGRPFDQIAAGMDGRVRTSPGSPAWSVDQLLTAEQGLRVRDRSMQHGPSGTRPSLYQAFARKDAGCASPNIRRSADVLLLCGDLTEFGLPEEAEELAADIRSAVRIPCIGVIGNHDYESGNRKPSRTFSIRLA